MSAAAVMPQLFTEREAAAALGVSVYTPAANAGDDKSDTL
jgi:hypothetical protein